MTEQETRLVLRALEAEAERDVLRRQLEAQRRQVREYERLLDDVRGELLGVMALVQQTIDAVQDDWAFRNYLVERGDERR